QRAADAQYPENQTTECALYRGYQHVALDGGAYHAGELDLQATLGGVGQRNGAADLVDQLLAVAQQEEQQVQHDEEADEEFKSTLANGEHLGGQVLAAGHGPGRYLLAQAVEVAHADTVQLFLYRGW